MRLTGLTLHVVELPLVSPFTTSFGTQTVRRALLLEADFDIDGAQVTGWGESVAGENPLYSSEYVEGAIDVIHRWLVPTLVSAGAFVAESVAEIMRPIVGHNMAKAAIEMAALEAQLRHREISFADYLGATRRTVPSGVSVGIQPTIPGLIDTVAGYLDQGYARIKLKIKPDFDLAQVRAVRETFGHDVLLQVDANAAYTLADTPRLKRLDEFELLLIEQPLGQADLRQHAKLAASIATPICLDESIVSAEAAADAIMLGAASIINIKPGRVGGYLEARRIHDLARAHGVAVWCGGMLETGLGRAANTALAALPGFTLPGDISGSDRFYAEDITTEPITMINGTVGVPTGTAFGVQIDRDKLERFSTLRIPVALP
jgi:o-succinylbenzoate synthase